jgi:hypothetical protein
MASQLADSPTRHSTLWAGSVYSEQPALPAPLAYDGEWANVSFGEGIAPPDCQWQIQ